ncbi:MAG: hypothetical protein KDE27_25900 [Planctomycetes bacterium]|nr:hypothetical protein [Planctomycetota bacterium]
MISSLRAAEPGFWQRLWDFFASPPVFWTMFGVGIGTIVLAVVLLPLVVVRLDADYFVATPKQLASHRTFGRWLFLIARNLVGSVLVLVGLILLLLPGQGLLMIFGGLLMMDFPGKRRLELAIVRRPAILKLLNGMRTKRGHAPFEVELHGSAP